MIESKKTIEYRSSLLAEYEQSMGNAFNLINFRAPDMAMYGKVDREYNSIIPKNNSNNFELIEPGVHVFDFVADAYRDFDAHIQETKIKAGERLPSQFYSRSGIKRNSFFLNLTPASSYVDPIEMHTSDLDFIFDAFISYVSFHNRKKHISTPKDFVKYFVNFSLSDYYPEIVSLTKSSYMRKTIVPYDVSGLIIKFSDDDPDDLNETMEKYTYDPVFKFYANESKKFGFYVDYHAPWTLVANVGSAAMRKYMAARSVFFSKNGSSTGTTSQAALGHVHKYKVDASGNGVTTMTSAGPNHVHEIKNWSVRHASILIDGELSMPHAHATEENEFFSTYYDKTCEVDIEHMKSVIHNMYNTFVNLFAFQQKRLIHDMQVYTQGSFRQKITRQEFDDLYPDTFWARYYLDLRINEDKVFIPKSRYQSLVRELLSICVTEGVIASSNFVNDEIVKRIHYLVDGPNKDKKWKNLSGRGTLKKMAEHFT